MEKCGKFGQATDDNITTCTLFARWITKVTDIHSEYLIPISFPRLNLLRERVLILRCTYIACLVKHYSDRNSGDAQINLKCIIVYLFRVFWLDSSSGWEGVVCCTITNYNSDEAVILGKVDCVWNVTAHAQKPDFFFRAKRKSPFKSVAGGGRRFSRLLRSRGVRISGSNAGYTMFRGSVKSTSYPLHSPVSPSLPLPCVTVYHQISTGVYYWY